VADGTVSLHSQQLLELLAVVSALPDEASAVRGAVDRAAQALEAEVAAVVVDGRITASVGFAAGDVPASDLLAVARLDRSHLDIDGLGSCVATSAGWGGAKPGHLILARWGDEPFAAEERNLVRGMARVLELTLTMLRTLAAEHEQRQRSERHAAENARLLTSLQERQRLLQHLFEIQRAISRRRPLAQILEQVAVAARDLSGDEVVALWLRDPDDTEHARLHASLGLGADAGRLPPVRLADAGVAGQAMLGDAVVIRNAADPGPDPHVHASIAAPVHESGTVTGSLPIASCRPERVYTDADAEMLRAFAEHVSIALTDAKTVDLMHQAFHD